MSRSDGLLGLTFLDLLLRSTLILGLLILVLALLHRRSAALRHFVGFLGMSSLLLLPLGMLTLPGGWGPLPSLRALLERPDPAAGASDPGLQIGWLIATGALLWFAGVVLILRRFLRARQALKGFFSRGREVPAFALPMARAVRALSQSSRSQLRVSSEIDVPVTFGVSSARVLLPSSAEEWEDERLQLVLLHELAHVRRRDLLAQSVGLLVCALYWFHPLVWLVGRRLDLERERACDDLVLGCEGNAVVYARQLVEFAGSLQGRPVSAFGVSMARPSQLGRRLAALLDGGMDRRTMRPAQAFLAVLLGMVVLLPMAASGPGLNGPEEAPAAEDWSEMEESWEGSRSTGHEESVERGGHQGSRPVGGHGHLSGLARSHRGHPSGDHGGETSGHGRGEPSGHGHQGGPGR